MLPCSGHHRAHQRVSNASPLPPSISVHFPPAPPELRGPYMVHSFHAHRSQRKMKKKFPMRKGISQAPSSLHKRGARSCISVARSVPELSRVPLYPFFSFPPSFSGPTILCFCLPPRPVLLSNMASPSLSSWRSWWLALDTRGGGGTVLNSALCAGGVWQRTVCLLTASVR